MSEATAAFERRFQRVLEFVDAQLGECLTVERLSSVAAFSKYHFHRQFQELFAISVHWYVQLMRLRRATQQLAFRTQMSILQVALDAGYESHEAFSRAFKKSVGQTPSEFREQPDWEGWHMTYQPIATLRTQHMKPDSLLEAVERVDFPQTRVALLEHRGDSRLVGDSVRKLIAWRKENRLPPSVSATYNLLYEDPAEVPPADFHLDLCVATDRPIADNAHGVVASSIPAGRCARLRHVGSEDKLFQAVKALYATWLPASGEEPRDFPLFLQRVTFFPEVPEPEVVTDIFLPLR